MIQELKRVSFLLIAVYLSLGQHVLGQGASTAYIVDEGFKTTGTFVVNANFTLSGGISTNSGNSNFGRNAPSLDFNNGNTLEYDWSASGTVADHVSFLYAGLGGAGGTYKVQESSNGAAWTTVAGGASLSADVTAATFDATLLSTSRYVKITYTTGSLDGLLDDFRVRKSGVAPATSMDLIYELINAGSGTTCGDCEGYDEFVFFETGSDALDVHYLELVSPTMTYGPGDLAMGGNGTVGAGNSNTNINWILNGSLTATQTTYTTKLNTECGCAAFKNIPATNIIPANSKVLVFTGSAPDAKFNTASLAGQTVYVIYSNDNSGCTGSGKYGNSCASNCTRYLTVFNHDDGDISNKNFTTPASTSGGDMWDFAHNKAISVGCTLTVLPIDLLYFNAAYNSTSNIVNLNWATASETNNKLFTIQKSIDGIDWHNIYTTPGAGNSTSNLYYNAVDENPTKGIAYYRLMQTDLDGLYKTSDPVVISVDLQTKNVLIAPNPANTSISITFNTITDGVSTLNVYDLAGRLINTQQLNVVKGTNTTLLNIASYINGMYFITINNTLQQLSTKFVVTHN